MKRTNASTFSLARDLTLEQAALCFQALSDPTRLRILQALKEKERSVQELVGMFDWTQPNISRHLVILARAGFVKKSKRGSYVFYALKNRDSMRLCDWICVHVRETAASISK